MNWTEQYRPHHINEIIGNNSAIRQMVEWAKNWTPNTPPLLITGKPGIGKTSSAIALANDMNWEVLELNASDSRTKSVIDRIVGNSSTTTSLFGSTHKLIIIDEADNIEGNSDRGGALAISQAIKKASHPIIIIANDKYGVSDSIRKLCTAIKFISPKPQTIARRISEICLLNHISISNESIKKISEDSSGDIRSAINMLFASSTGKSEIGINDIRISSKDERASIFDLVSGIYSNVSDSKIQKLSFECDEKPDIVIQWIEEQLLYTPNQLSRDNAYSMLSLSDIYLGRSIRRQYYTLWRYAMTFMTHGVSQALFKQSSGAIGMIKPPSRWRRMSTAKKQKIIRQNLASKLSEGYNIPEFQFIEIYLDLISKFAISSPIEFCERYDLNIDDLSILLHSKREAMKVFKETQNILKDKDLKIKKSSKSKPNSDQKTEIITPNLEKT
ncbi:MAG TPA: replication factor C large subunit, partial [Methanocorpusculum sp.]|nr:replication factor C large subunit [Methanocorpusculum sp.]